MKIMRAALPLSPGRILSPETHWFSMENMLLPGTRTIMPQVIMTELGPRVILEKRLANIPVASAPRKIPAKDPK